MTYRIIGGNLSPAIVQKDWGIEITLGVSNRVALKRVEMQPNTALSRQFHVCKDEIYYVLRGKAELELGPNGEIKHILSEGDSAHLPPGVIHRVIAGEHGVVIVEASTPEITDIIRLEDRYHRRVNPGVPAPYYCALMVAD